MFRKLFLIAFILISVTSLSGQHTHYSYTRLSIKEGLSQASVETVLLDKRGDLWIGSRDGLNHYSQQKMKIFFHSMEDAHSLPSNHIIHLEEDSLENIWVASLNGLSLYDRKKNHFTTYTRSHVQSSLCIEDGVLFGGENVLYYYDYQKKNFERIHIQPESAELRPIEYRVQKLLRFDKHQVLVSTRKKGMFLYHLKNKEFKPFSSFVHSNLLLSTYLASDGYVYASFFRAGLLRFDRNGNILETYNVDNSPLNNNYILDLNEYQGKLWMATDGGGINLMDLKDYTFTHLIHNPDDSSSLPVNSIIKIYKDYHGKLWLGTIREGLLQLNESSIKSYGNVSLNNKSGLSHKSIISLFEEKDGNIWIGTDGGGINLYNPKTDEFTHFPSTYGDKVASIAEISEKELLVSVYGKGFFLFNKKTAQYRPFIIVNKEINHRECFYGYLPLANQVTDDKIYIISYGSWVYHIPTKTFTPMMIPEEYQGSTEALVMCHSNDKFSLLKRGHQAFIVNQANDKVDFLFEVAPHENIRTMTCDNNENIWIGTNHGLRLYDMQLKELRNIPTPLFNNVSFLTIDGQGHLWICAENKFFTYLLKENKFTFRNHSDGLSANEIIYSFQRTFNREVLYLGGSEGLVKIANSITEPKEEHLDIYLSDIYYNGQPHLEEQQSTNHFNFPWNYHSLVLSVGVKGEDVFQKRLFRYTIRGKREHTFDSYDPLLNLSSLSPGNYTILAACNTKNGNYTVPVTLLTFTVTPPWYKNGWVISGFVLLVICAVVGGSYWTYRKKEQKMKGNVSEFLRQMLYNTIETEDTSDALAEEAIQPAMSKADEEFMNRLDTLIDENMSSEELTVKFLTDRLAMSRASLYNKVKTLTGFGVNDYINRLRIEKSVHLLTNTDLSINEISYEVGFNYPRYFSTSFKQVKGMTPTRFKEEHKKRTT